MNKDIIPIESSIESSKKHPYKEWVKFARRVQKNPFMRSYLMKKANYKCEWCGERIYRWKFLVNHKNYDHRCMFGIEKKIELDSYYNKKSLTLPDCEKCYEENHDFFLQCVEKLSVVHSICNKKINDYAILLEKR